MHFISDLPQLLEISDFERFKCVAEKSEKAEGTTAGRTENIQIKRGANAVMLACPANIRQHIRLFTNNSDCFEAAAIKTLIC